MAAGDFAVVPASQNAHIGVALHLGVNHAEIADDAGAADSAEEANVVADLAVDIEVGDSLSVALELGVEPVSIADADGQPPVAAVPFRVDGAGSVAVRTVEVQRPGQFVALAGADADRLARGDGEGEAVVEGVVVVVRTPVAVREIVAHRVQLLQVADFDQPVPVRVVHPVGRLGLRQVQGR